MVAAFLLGGACTFVWMSMAPPRWEGQLVHLLPLDSARQGLHDTRLPSATRSAAGLRVFNLIATGIQDLQDEAAGVDKVGTDCQLYLTKIRELLEKK